MGEDFPASWYLTVAMPMAEEVVVENDIRRDCSESESDEEGGELTTVGGGIGSVWGDLDL